MEELRDVEGGQLVFQRSAQHHDGPPHVHVRAADAMTMADVERIDYPETILVTVHHQHRPQMVVRLSSML